MMIRFTTACATALVITIAYGQIEQRTLRPAQDHSTQAIMEQPAAYSLHVGVFVAAKAGVNTTVARGRKTDLNFNTLPDLGISIFAPLQSGSRFGAGLDIGYATYSYVNKPESGVTDANTIIEQYSYVNMFPHVNLSGIVLGVNLGFAPNGRAKTKSGNTAIIVTDGSQEIGSEHLGTLVELRLGGNFPIWDNPNGQLNLYLLAGYTLSGLYSDYRTYIYSRDNYALPSADKNPKPASIAVGLAYYFRIPIKP
jgi:hypothetical protein